MRITIISEGSKGLHLYDGIMTGAKKWDRK